MDNWRSRPESMMVSASRRRAWRSLPARTLGPVSADARQRLRQVCIAAGTAHEHSAFGHGEDDQAQTRWCPGFIPVENGGMYEEMDDVVRGVGQVCISASSLEWSLAYCSSVLRCMGDDWFIGVFSSPGQPLKQFRKLTSAVAARMPELQADTEQLLATAEQLLVQRHRVVHSAMMGQLIQVAAYTRRGMRRPTSCGQ
jgi:hypothetical protein